jgi:hypothetical protein
MSDQFQYDVFLSYDSKDEAQYAVWVANLLRITTEGNGYGA